MIKNKKLYVTILLFLSIVAFSVAFLPIGTIKNTFAQNNKYVASSNGVLTYDENEFEVVEDYSAFVPAAVASPKGGVQLLDPNGEQLMRLDQGKKGLLVKSVQSGDDVEGDSFSFANPLTGDFEMDFRVFSEKTVESGVVQLQMKNGCDGVFTNDNVLSALDIRRLGITITSISNPQKAFTIYVYSGQSYAYNHQVSLSVYVHGESWYSWEMGEEYRGYGIENNKNSASDYGYNTSLVGTSMSNANSVSPETFSTTVKFDIDTMCVYGVSKKADKKFLGSIGYVGATYVEEDILVRNLATNSTTADGTGVLEGKRLEQLGTLSKEDFINGYTTSITIENMTSNDTVLTRAVKNSDGGEEYYNAILEKVADPYDRYAKMIIYSVNGQEFVKNDDWNVDYVSGDTIVEFDTAKGISQVENPWSGEKVNASYVTDVKYGTENGSTKFVANGQSVEFSTKTPYVRYHGDKAMFTLPVYVSGTTETYVLQVWTKASGDYLGEAQITPNTWATLNFSSNSNWNFDLNDVYFTVHKSTSWTTDDGVSIYFGKMTVSHSNTNYLPEKHIQLTSSATNISAEGNSYGLSSEDFKLSDGTYVLGMTAKSENYASSAGSETFDFGDFYTENVYSTAESGQVYLGTGSGTYQKDPYSDVRELGLTIRSTIDPSKAFTIYLSASTFRRARTTVRVAVEGESYVNGSGQKGFSYVNHTNTGTYREFLQKGGNGGIGGTMGQWGTTGTSYNSMNELFSYVKFDPATMTVYTDNGGWKVARKLSSNMLGDATNSACDTLKTLNASDFANGSFTMELFVSEMNTEWNKGLSNVYSLMNGVQTAHSIGYSTLSESYDRKCIIDVVSGRLNSGITLDSETAYSVQQSGYEVTYSFVNLNPIKDVIFDEEVTLNAPMITSLFESKILDGEATYQNEDGSDTGTITFIDGKGVFSPNTIGNYIITFNGQQRKIKAGYGISYFDGQEEKEVIITDTAITLGDFVARSNDNLFIGWTIEGQDGVYSNEYSFEAQNGTHFEAQFIDLKMADPSVRMVGETGLRFKATLSKTDYENFVSLVGEENYEMTYSVKGNLKSYEKPIIFDNFYYDDANEEYFMLLSVVNLSEKQYALDFDAYVTLTYKTTDKEEITLKAIQEKDPYKYIREVADNQLKSGEEYNQDELKILNEFATLRYATRIFNSIPTNNHVQGIGVDENYLYSNYGPWLIKQDIETGEVVGMVENMRVTDEHGGNVVVHDGKVYIALMLSGDVTLVGNHTMEKYSFPNCFVIEIDADKIVGVVDALNTDIVRCVYVGHPIVELALSSKGYDANGNELSDEYWGIGGRLGIVNALDSIAWGPAPGHKDGKEYLTLGFSLPGHAIISDGGYYLHQRVDADYFPVMQFDVSKWTDDMYITFSELMDMRYSGRPFTQDLFKGPREFDNIWYYYMGPQDYGIQNLCYDAYQNVYIMGTYGMGQSYSLYNQEKKFTSFRGFVLDCDNAEYMEIPLSGGLKGYVVKEKCGQEGKQGIYGFMYNEVKWGTGVAATGDGYYYVCVSGNNEFGGSTAENLLYRWHINEENKNTASQPFEQIK